MTSRKLHETSRKLLEKYVLDFIPSAFTKITQILILLSPSSEQFLSYLGCCPSSGCGIYSFLPPNKTYLWEEKEVRAEMDGIADSMVISLSKLQEVVKDRGAWCPWGYKESDTT